MTEMERVLESDSWTFVLKDNKLKQVKLKDEPINIEEIDLKFKLNPETNELELYSTSPSISEAIDQETALGSYRELMEGRNAQLLRITSRLLRYKILKKYRPHIEFLEKYYVSKEDRIREGLPVKAVKIIETTPRTILEEMILGFAEDITPEKIYDEYQSFGIYLDELYCRSPDCEVSRENLPDLDEPMVVFVLDSYGFPALINAPFHKDCAPKVSLNGNW